MVPWKYGFKSIKSIVKISFVEKEPTTTWNLMAPYEYGFYSNVNPTCPTGAGARRGERRLTGRGGPFAAILAPRIDTQMFNGYAEEVAHLYQGMNLAKNF